MDFKERFGGALSAAIVLLSGGIDSMACAHWSITRGFATEGLYIDYGQRAAEKELLAANAVARHFGINLRQSQIRSCATSFGAGEVRGRNGLLAFAALLHSESNCNYIISGIHAGTPYFDCSAVFHERISALFCDCSGGRVEYLSPFLSLRKQEIIAYARAFPALTESRGIPKRAEI